MVTKIKIGDVKIGNSEIVLIAGPCVIETEEITFYTAKKLKEITTKLKIGFIFKTSYDKANRSSIKSYRGPGLNKGLEILGRIKKILNIPILVDVHQVSEVGPVSEVADIIQIPAFLCRQTDLVVSVARALKPVNVKKGQFLSPFEVKNIIEKIESVGNKKILITERGNFYGYNNLVVDFRNLVIMKRYGYPVIFDATHSVQQPAALGEKSGGQREFVLFLSRAAVAVGIDGLFLEVHPKPDKALCDSATMLKLDELPKLISVVREIDKIVKNYSCSK